MTTAPVSNTPLLDKMLALGSNVEGLRAWLATLSPDDLKELGIELAMRAAEQRNKPTNPNSFAPNNGPSSPQPVTPTVTNLNPNPNLGAGPTNNVGSNGPNVTSNAQPATGTQNVVPPLNGDAKTSTTGAPTGTDVITVSGAPFPVDQSKLNDAATMIKNAQALAKPGPAGAQIPNDVWNKYQTPADIHDLLMTKAPGSSSTTTPTTTQPGGPIPPYDPAKGPQITLDKITPQMLVEPYTRDELRNMVDPAAFLNMRAALNYTPNASGTGVWDSFNGRMASGFNPNMMSTQGQADGMYARLKAMGLSDAPFLRQGQLNDFGQGPFSYVYGPNENRRIWEVGVQETDPMHWDPRRINIASLYDLYARQPVDVADDQVRQMIAQLNG
jgi:hypothetical protein